MDTACSAICIVKAARPPCCRARPRAEGLRRVQALWIVEHTFDWLAHWSGLLRDHAGRFDASAARIASAAALSGVEALPSPMPVHDTAS